MPLITLTSPASILSLRIRGIVDSSMDLVIPALRTARHAQLRSEAESRSKLKTFLLSPPSSNLAGFFFWRPECSEVAESPLDFLIQVGQNLPKSEYSLLLESRNRDSRHFPTP